MQVASSSCACVFLLVSASHYIVLVWVRMVCSLHFVTTGSRDRANVRK